ncbi:MAG: cysteine desulfurase [Lachnospiraceae bacterium]|nr:cysteine desulfurase [Lachnospiraceae bacterium]
MKRHIYADNAATTKLDRDAFEAMLPWLQEQYGNASQPYAFARKPREALLEARMRIAECIGAFPEEIYFTSGGTESDNWAIKGMMRHGDNRATITSRIEHHAVLHACKSIEGLGFPVVYLPVDGKGLVTPEVLSQVITNETKLVSVMLVNNEIGTIEPVADLACIAHDHGALFHTDAVQAVGHIPVDVKSLGVDLLSASAHKFNGPKGVGFLYIKKDTEISPYADGGAQEAGMRAGTENIASIVGMAVALQKSVHVMKETQYHLRNLERMIVAALSKAGIDYIRNGQESHVPGNLSLSFKGYEGEMLLHRLDLMGIMVSTGSACDSKNTRISHVLRAIDVDKNYAMGTIRISLGKDNTEEEAVQIAESIIKIINGQ